MKDFLIKYLFLSYKARVLGREYKFLRCISVIVPVFCVAVIATLLFSVNWFVWVIFALLILLTFPILKNNFINYGAAIIVPLMIGGSHYFGYEWWEPIPFFYFALGVFKNKTGFLFFSVKYKDLKDWEQRLQYLRIPLGYKSYDETEPVPLEKKRLIRNLEGLEDLKYGLNNNVNVLVALVPFISVILTIAILIVFQDGIERFPDRRFF